MTDGIREKAIEAAARAIYNCWNLQAGWVPWVEDSPTKWHASWQDKARREARAAIAAWEAALWRPEGEAEAQEDVLVINAGEIAVAFRENGEWFQWQGRHMKSVSHFRPLPAPPEDAK